MPIPNVRDWDFDVDRYLNPIIPYPRWQLIPRPISHFLGHRPHLYKKEGNIVAAAWALIGAFCGLLVIAVVSTHIPSFKSHGAPIVVGSFVSERSMLLLSPQV